MFRGKALCTIITVGLFCTILCPQTAHAADRVLVLGKSLSELLPDAYRATEQGLPSSAVPPELIEQHRAVIVDLTGVTPDRLDAVVTLARQFVQAGKGCVFVGVARELSPLSALVGAQVSGPTGAFKARLWFIDTGHPVSKGLRGTICPLKRIETGELSNDCRALVAAYQDGGLQPYVWLRRFPSRGRLFISLLPKETYTTPVFRELVARAVRWATGDLNLDRSVFRYKEVENIPVYRPDRRVERQTKMQLPLPAELSMQRYALPEGLRLQLFASEPLVVKPICMTFGPRGRLWVVESVDYPNNVLPNPERNGNDRIKILEDTDGDGRADKATIFADKLNIPTSLLHVRGGLLVACAPHILFLKDTDGDRRADVRRIVFTGFGRADTHAVHANFHYGFDNWIWATVGYSGGEIKLHGKRISFRQGVFRFKPDGSAFEFVAPTTNNTWGLGFSPDGDVFVSTANNQHSFYLAIPNRYFERVRGWYATGIARIEDHKRYHPIGPYRQVDFHGGFTAASGHNFYGDTRLLPIYNNRAALVTEPTGHLVHVCLPVQRGSGFVTRDGYNLVASDDEWAAPIAAAPGPDGAVWFLDWYNFIVQHNPTPPGFRTGLGNAYETPLRDKTHGRVYRVVAEGEARQEQPNFPDASDDELVALLGHESMWWRLHAQQELVERGDLSVAPKLESFARANRDSRAAIHVLWTLHGLGVTDELVRAARVCLGSKHPAVRRAAVQTLPPTRETVGILLEAGALSDDDFRVRLAVLLKFADCPPDDRIAAKLVGVFLDESVARDRWLPLAAICAAATNDVAFLKAACTVARASELLARAVEVVAEHWSRGAPAPEQFRQLVRTLQNASEPVLNAFCQGVIRGWPKGHDAGNLDESDRRLVLHLVRSTPPAVRPGLVLLFRRVGWSAPIGEFVAKVREELLHRLDNRSLPTRDRLEAAERLLRLDPSDETVRALVSRIAVAEPPEFNKSLIDFLARTDSPAVASELLQRWRTYSPELRRLVVRTLLQRPVWASQLVAALRAGVLNRADLTLDQRQLLLAHPDRHIREQAQALFQGAVVSAGREDVLKRYLPLADRKGNPTAGRKVFEENCAKCHRFEEIGEAVGPDLTGVAVRGRRAILTDILDPNRSVEGNFTQYLVLTRDGRVLTGLLAAETRTAIELIDTEGNRVIVLRENIEEITNSGKSLMPEGFEQQLKPEQIVDLLAFLTQQRRFVPIPIRRAATIVTTQGMFYRKESPTERLVFSDWGPKTFKGVPFHLVDPKSTLQPNAIMLYSPNGAVSREMPRRAEVECNLPARVVHILGGVAGWGYPASPAGTTSMVVRFHYADGSSEDHRLINGVHVADYIRVVDVPGSELAFVLRGRQLRYLAIEPKKREVIRKIEFLKGDDNTAPIVMAITVELPGEGRASSGS